jgi:hypothetical protein
MDGEVQSTSRESELITNEKDFNYHEQEQMTK